MGVVHSGNKNPNWKGGRSLAPNGYMLVRSPDHPLADVRGYIYEHRLVACKKLGRLLRPGEIVHHKNGKKTDNRPANLEIMASRAHHHVEHRDASRGLRHPDEPNVTTKCACGCGESFRKYDKQGRPRKFVNGHNPRF